MTVSGILRMSGRSGRQLVLGDLDLRNNSHRFFALLLCRDGDMVARVWQWGLRL